MQSFSYTYDTSILYFVIGCILVLSCIMIQDRNFKNTSTLITTNICYLLLAQSVLFIFFAFLEHLFVVFKIKDYSFFGCFNVFLWIVINFISSVYPYFILCLIKKYKKQKIWEGDILSKFKFALFILSCIVSLGYTCLCIYAYAVNLEDKETYLFHLLSGFSVGSIIFFILSIRQFHEFLSTLLADTFLSRNANNATLFLVIYLQLFIWPLSFFFSVPVMYMFAVLLVYVVHVVSQHRQISIDFLTGLNNRNELLRYLEKLFKKSSELDNKTHIAFIDINDFKKVNDTYGHNQGDKALLSLTACLKEASYDYECFICRYAGDEFTVVFKDSEELTVKSYLSRLQNLIDDTNNSHKHKFNLSISVGFVSYNDNYKTVDDFINAADVKMYQEKEKNKAREVLQR